MKITKTLLETLNACRKQVDLFDKTFPKGTYVTKEACLLVLKAGIDFNWAAENLLKNLDAYWAATQPHRDAYKAASQLHWGVYCADIQPHRDACKAAIQPYWDVYEEQKSLVFFELFTKENYYEIFGTMFVECSWRFCPKLY